MIEGVIKEEGKSGWFLSLSKSCSVVRESSGALSSDALSLFSCGKRAEARESAE